GNEPLPLGERQFVDGGPGLRDGRAPADRVHEDVDAAVLTDHAVGDVLDIGGVEGIGATPMRAAASVAYAGHRLVEPSLIGVDAHHDAALTTDDLGRGLSDPARCRRDHCHLISESHRHLLAWREPPPAARRRLITTRAGPQARRGAATRNPVDTLRVVTTLRSEERRVGKESSRWKPRLP